MDRKTFYLFLTIVGIILPYVFFIPFLLEHGFDISLFFELMIDNTISTMVIVDLVTSSLIFFIFMLYDKRETQVTNFQVELAILATFAIGLSSGLPLYLYFRTEAD